MRRSARQKARLDPSHFHSKGESTVRRVHFLPKRGKPAKPLAEMRTLFPRNQVPIGLFSGCKNGRTKGSRKTMHLKAAMRGLMCAFALLTASVWLNGQTSRGAPQVRSIRVPDAASPDERGREFLRGI